MRLENETAWICLLALIAAARIFVFSAAMPLYGNVDEAAHFDVIKKYARGYWPSEEVERFDAESAAQKLGGRTQAPRSPVDRCGRRLSRERSGRDVLDYKLRSLGRASIPGLGNPRS